MGGVLSLPLWNVPLSKAAVRGSTTQASLFLNKYYSFTVFWVFKILFIIRPKNWRLGAL